MLKIKYLDHGKILQFHNSKRIYILKLDLNVWNKLNKQHYSLYTQQFKMLYYENYTIRVIDS
jgi:hypothetical protein